MEVYSESPYIETYAPVTQKLVNTSQQQEQAKQSNFTMYIGLVILLVVILIGYFYYTGYFESFLGHSVLDDPAHDSNGLEAQINKLNQMQKKNLGF